MSILMANLARARPPATLRVVRGLRRAIKRWTQYNPASLSKAHVAHHYDLSGGLYDLFLDRDRQYSCAYFPRPAKPGRSADRQEAPHRSQAASRPAGSEACSISARGWGGLALDLARDCGANVLGVTLSEEQLAIARERAREGRAGRALQIRTDRLSRARRHVRPHRLGRHVRACGRALLRRLSSPRCAIC